MRSYYAVTYAYGRTRLNRDGDTPNVVSRFAAFRDRAKFLKGKEIMNLDAPGFTEAVDSRHPLVRKLRSMKDWRPLENHRGEYVVVFD